MKKRLLFQFSVVVLAVFAVTMLAACGGSAGFSSQKALAKAYLDMQAKTVLADYGENTSIEDQNRFIYGSRYITSADLEKDKFEIQQKKANHNAKMKGNWVIDYNDDGSAKSKLSGDSLTEYKEKYNGDKAMAKSYKLVSALKSEEKTKKATPIASLQGLTSAIEVWDITYDYTPYKNGVIQTALTGQKMSITIVKIDGKWYRNA